jgi:hypothetical protein
VTSRTVEAHFWAAPGVEVFKHLALPVPPPRSWRVALRAPLSFSEMEELTPETVLLPQIVDFRLTNYVAGSEVAHYELDSKPPKGWEWLVVGDEMRTERLR